MPRSPHDSLRDAFGQLPTPDRVAFVIEATFTTIADALGETGRRVADAVRGCDVESAFRAPSAASSRADAPTSGPAARPPGAPPQPPPSAPPAR